MRSRASRTLLTLLSLGTASVLLTGCPKASPPSPGAGAGSVAGQVTGAGPGALAGGASGAGGAGAAGGAAAAGTTFPALPSPQEFVETAELRDIRFDFDRYTIRPQDADILSSDAHWLRAHRTAQVLIEGHADERGTSEYNLALGERRAKATRDHLVSLGIDSVRITLISYGKERPLCTGHVESCWARNRRAHFLVRVP